MPITRQNVIHILADRFTFFRIRCNIEGSVAVVNNLTHSETSSWGDDIISLEVGHSIESQFRYPQGVSQYKRAHFCVSICIYCSTLNAWIIVPNLKTVKELDEGCCHIRIQSAQMFLERLLGRK